MLSNYITQVKILDCRVGKTFLWCKLLFKNLDFVKGLLKLENVKFKRKEYQRLAEKVGQWVQMRVVYCDNKFIKGITITPTFFDSKQRCKKCGRFYKLYCKHCYERSKAICAVLNRFEEEYLKGPLNVENIKKIK